MKVHNHALHPCKKTLAQFEDCLNHDFVIAGALMPDAHAGYVAPIGSVLLTKGKIVPSWVGFDIGCGMSAAKLDISSQTVKKLKKQLYLALKEGVPNGMGKSNTPTNVSEESKKELKELIENFKARPHNKRILNIIQSGAINHVGSLGDGNHFLEVCESDSDSNAWIVVHSGSRGIGYKIATQYMKEAAGNAENFEQTFALDANSESGQEYLNALEFGLAYALLNRKEMIRQSIKLIEKTLREKIKWELWTNKNHNHAILENDVFVHRKGATPAKLGERGIIPANMRDGSFLVEGLGNKAFLESSSHGAGRILGRVAAKNTIAFEDFKSQMKDVEATVNESTLDEAPDAYKNIYDVMEKQKDSVKIVAHLKPLICVKGEKRHKK